MINQLGGGSPDPPSRRMLKIVNPDPRYSSPAFAQPPRTGFLYLAAAVAPPTGAPFVRPNPRRRALLARLTQLAADLAQRPRVTQATVYRAVLIPPPARGGAHPARFDVAVLVETTSVEDLHQVGEAEPVRQMLTELTLAGADPHLMAARCVRSLGPVDRTRPGLFLFNHFTAGDSQLATALWEHLAAWYVAETGLSNSTLLAPIEPSDYVLVNHARWNKSLPRLAAEQLFKPSFHRYVRANLRANHVVAMPALYRLASPPQPEELR